MNTSDFTTPPLPQYFFPEIPDTPTKYILCDSDDAQIFEMGSKEDIKEFLWKRYRENNGEFVIYPIAEYNEFIEGLIIK